MANSIIQERKECLVCKTTVGLHKHHIYGSANRNRSEKFGLWCWLCQYHHLDSKDGVHFNKQFMEDLHILGQIAYENKYGGESFLQEFGKNYL